MADIKNLKLCKCFIHFDDVSQSLTQVTDQRLSKFISCRKRWVKLEGEKSEICRKSYGLFTDEDVAEFLSANTCENLQWYYHQNCYKRICDEYKLKMVEAKHVSSESNKEKTGSEVNEPQKKLTRLSFGNDAQVSGVPARTYHVLQPRCIICEKESDLFVTVSLKIRNEYNATPPPPRGNMGHRLFLDTNERKSPTHRGKQNKQKPLLEQHINKKVLNLKYLRLTKNCQSPHPMGYNETTKAPSSPTMFPRGGVSDDKCITL